MKILLYTIMVVMLGLYSCTENEKNKSHEQKKIKKIDQIKCNEVQEIDSSSSDPIIVKTCTWGSYKFITTGISDYKGRYSYEGKVYEFKNNDYVEISNSDIFNSDIKNLEKNINEKIELDLSEARKEEELLECLSSVNKPQYKINDMRISFDSKNNIVFNVTYGLGSDCFNVDGTSVKFTLSEIEKYLK